MNESPSKKPSESITQELLHNSNDTLMERIRIRKCLHRELIFTNPKECIRQKRIKNYKGLYEQEAFLVPFSKVRKNLLASTRSSSQKQTMYLHLEFDTINEVVKVLSRILPKHSNLRGLYLFFHEDIAFHSWKKIGRLISTFSHLNSLIVNFRLKKPEMDVRELARIYKSMSMIPRLENVQFAVTLNENNVLQSGFVRAGFIPDNRHSSDGLLSKLTSRFKNLKSMSVKVLGQDCTTATGIASYAKVLSELPKLEDVSLKLYDCRRVTNQGFYKYLDSVQANPHLKKLAIALNISEDVVDTQKLSILHPIWTDKKLEYGSLEVKLASLYFPETINATISGIERISCLGKLMLSFHSMTIEALTGIKNLPFVCSKLLSLTDLTLGFINCYTLDTIVVNNMIYGLNSCPRLKKASLEFLSSFKKVGERITEIETPLVGCPTLKELTLSFVDCAELQEKQITRILELLAHCQNLEALTLQMNWCNSLSDEPYQRFHKVISNIQLLKSLTWGFEGVNTITRNSAIPFGKMVTRLTLLRYIDVNLSHFIEVEDHRMPLIAGWFSELKYLEAFKFNVKGCKLVSDEGIKALCTNFKGLRKLGTIMLVWSSNNLREVSKTLASQLAANLPSLYCIELHGVKKNGQTSKVCIRLTA